MDNYGNLTEEEYREITEYTTEEFRIDEGSSNKRALIYGLIGIALTTTFIGGVPFAIVAIIHGIKAVKTRPQDKRGKVGIILGCVELGLFLLMLCWLAFKLLLFMFLP